MSQILTPGEGWVEGSARVVASVYRYARFWEVDLEDGLDRSRYLITFTYRVDGKVYVGEMEQFEPLEENTQLQILYNPVQPDQNNLSLYPSSSSSPLVKGLIVVFIAVILIALEHYKGWDFSER